MAIGGWIILCGRERFVRVVVVGRRNRWTPWSTKWWIIVLIIILVNVNTSCCCSSAGMDERGRLSGDYSRAIRPSGMLVTSQKDVPSPALFVFVSSVYNHCDHNA